MVAGGPSLTYLIVQYLLRDIFVAVQVWTYVVTRTLFLKIRLGLRRRCGPVKIDPFNYAESIYSDGITVRRERLKKHLCVMF